MSNRPARITQAEIERAIRAAKKAGATVVEVKIGDGVSIRIPLTSYNDITKLGLPEQSNVAALDAWMAKHAH